MKTTEIVSIEFSIFELRAMFTSKLTRLNTFLRPTNNATRRYCSEGNRKKWRTPWINREGEWQSALGVFRVGSGPSSEYLNLVQTKIDLRPSSIKRWWKRAKEDLEIINERYIPERVQILGNDLSAAHFVVFRNGAIKFYGKEEWIRKDEDEEYDLPEKFDPMLCVEAIDASKMSLHYDGLINLINLKRLKWLSFAGCPNIDNWCLDRVSGHFQDTLEYLDITDCPKISAMGLGCLYRMTNLKKLLVSNPNDDKNFELSCLMLEDVLPNLEIVGIKYISIDESSANDERDETNHSKHSQK
ncbi:hypothetical protein J437_LFUL015076 [Ladona fulva]|uniref:ATP synthase subunit s-like protein n=1 Tax=Ladona fulva TaxID=123851 RepID=A0A8K0P3Z1_LADFU|nr:hypothetical protein J437_LFUL015076 [Ladona fulva]